MPFEYCQTGRSQRLMEMEFAHAANKQFEAGLFYVRLFLQGMSTLCKL